MNKLSTSDLPIFRALEVKFLPQTERKPSRLVIIDRRNNKRKIISKSFDFKHIYDQAYNYLNAIGINVVGQTSDGRILLTDDFNTPIDLKIK